MLFVRVQKGVDRTVEIFFWKRRADQAGRTEFRLNF